MKFRLPLLILIVIQFPEDLSSQDAILGKVWIGDPHNIICIPANSVKVIERQNL